MIKCSVCGATSKLQYNSLLPYGWMISHWEGRPSEPKCPSCADKGATVFDDDDAKDIKDSDIPELNVSTNQDRP